MNQGNATIKNWVINKMFKAWTAQRADLSFSPKTFNQLWTAQNKNKAN
jgi:L-lactate dehydrogenase complex protein LldF